MLRLLRTHLWWLLPLTTFVVAFLYLLNLRAPMIGHDFWYFIDHLLVGRWYFAKQGLKPLQYIVQFCGGNVEYGNPQSLYYSTTQLLTLVMSPWRAIQLSVIGALALGYAGWWRCGRDCLRLSPPWRHVLALLVVTNGFYFVHITIGHVGYVMLPMLGWLYWYVLRNGNKKTLCHGERSRTMASGLLITIILYAGGYFSLLLFALSWLFVLPFVAIVSDRFWTALKRLIALGSVSLLLSASKLTAVLSYLKHFPRETELDVLPNTVSTWQYLVNALWMMPQRSELFAAIRWGSHEKSGWISIVTLLGLIAGIALLYRSRQYWRKHVTKGLLLILLGLIYLIFITQMISGRGWIVEALHQLPLLSSQHVTTRYIYLLSVPLTVLGVWCLEKKAACHPELCRRMHAASIFLWLTIITFFLTYRPLVDQLPYDPVNTLEAYKKIEADLMTHLDTPIETIKTGATDFRASSGLDCYDNQLIAGGNPQMFALHTGAVTDESDGYFNLMNPACYIYPAANNCQPGDRIRTGDRENFEAFRRGQTTDWEISVMQKWANWINVFAWLVTIGLLAVRILKSQKSVSMS